MYLKKYASVAAGAMIAASLAIAGPAHAADLITINPINGEWQNVAGSAVSGGTVDIQNGDPTAPTIRWGSPASNNGQSGYDFTSAVTPFDVNLVANGVSAFFTLGEFAHLNQPIFGSIDSVDLNVTYGVAVNGGFIGTFSSLFSFVHDETPNNGPCSFGTAAQNANGCSDKVIATLNTGASQAFNVGGVDYFLNVSGFEVGGVPTSEFITIEGANNLAQLNASIASRSAVAGVPEPETWALLLLGFFGIGGMMRSGKHRQRFSALQA
jgi:hypothetical protein